jgi:hypothetical protein
MSMTGALSNYISSLSHSTLLRDGQTLSGANPSGIFIYVHIYIYLDVFRYVFIYVFMYVCICMYDPDIKSTLLRDGQT